MTAVRRWWEKSWKAASTWAASGAQAVVAQAVLDGDDQAVSGGRIGQDR
nr:hypothetical protein [Streptomyces cyaneus]